MSSAQLVSSLSAATLSFVDTLNEAANSYLITDCSDAPHNEGRSENLKIISNWKFKVNDKTQKPELFHSDDVFPATFAQYLRWVKFEQQRLNFFPTLDTNENVDSSATANAFSVANEISRNSFGARSQHKLSSTAATLANIVLAHVEESGCDKITTGSGSTSSSSSLNFRYSYSSTRGDGTTAYSYGKAAANDNNRDGSTFHQCFPFDSKEQNAVGYLGIALFTAVAKACEGLVDLGGKSRISDVGIPSADNIVQLWAPRATIGRIKDMSIGVKAEGYADRATHFSVALRDANHHYQRQATIQKILRLVGIVWHSVETILLPGFLAGNEDRTRGSLTMPVAPVCGNPWLIFAPQSYNYQTQKFQFSELREKIAQWLGIRSFNKSNSGNSKQLLGDLDARSVALDAVLGMVTASTASTEKNTTHLRYRFLDYCFGAALKAPANTAVDLIGTRADTSTDAGLGLFPYLHLHQRLLSSMAKPSIINTESVIAEFAQDCSNTSPLTDLFSLCGPPMLHIATAAKAGSLRQHYLPDELTEHIRGKNNGTNKWLSVRSLLLVKAWDLPAAEPLLNVYQGAFKDKDTNGPSNLYLDIILVAGPVASEHIDYLHNHQRQFTEDAKGTARQNYCGIALFASVGVSYVTRLADRYNVTPSASGKVMTLKLPNGAKKRFPTIITGTFDVDEVDEDISSANSTHQTLTRYHGHESVAVMLLPHLTSDDNSLIGLGEIEASAATMAGKVRTMPEAFPVTIMPLVVSTDRLTCGSDGEKSRDFASFHTTIVATAVFGPSLNQFESTFWSTVSQLSKLFAVFYQHDADANGLHRDSRERIVLQYSGAGPSGGSLGRSNVTIAAIAALTEVQRQLSNRFVLNAQSSPAAGQEQGNGESTNDSVVETLMATEALISSLRKVCDLTLRESNVPPIAIEEHSDGTQTTFLSSKDPLEVAGERYNKVFSAIQDVDIAKVGVQAKMNGGGAQSVIVLATDFGRTMCVAPPMFHAVANLAQFRSNEQFTDLNQRTAVYCEMADLPPRIHVADGTISDWEVVSLTEPMNGANSDGKCSIIQAVMDAIHSHKNEARHITSGSVTSVLGRQFGSSGAVRASIDLANSLGSSVVVG